MCFSPDYFHTSPSCDFNEFYLSYFYGILQMTVLNVIYFITSHSICAVKNRIKKYIFRSLYCSQNVLKTLYSQFTFNDVPVHKNSICNISINYLKDFHIFFMFIVLLASSSIHFDLPLNLLTVVIVAI